MSASIVRVTVTEKGMTKVCDYLSHSEDFYYSVLEGGYIDHNGEVIFIDNRSPYEGMLLPLKELTEEQKQRWFKYFMAIFKED